MTNLPLGILQILLVLAALAACYVPLGNYMARVFTTKKHLGPERLVYRVCGVDPDAQQGWAAYARSVLAFSVISVLGLYALLRTQAVLPWSNGQKPVDPFIAFNTAASFVTNTDWQSYGGESTLGALSQMAGLAVQNFVSAAVGIAVCIAFVRSLAQHENGSLGNFWVDLVRCLFRILAPISVVFALVFMLGGVIQNLADPITVHTLAGGTQQIPGGPVASQEVIKLLGTNGGGFFNANSAHPFENPAAWTNLVQIFLILVIPVSLTRTFGCMVGSVKHGLAILGAMGAIFLLSLVSVISIELANPDSALRQAGAAMEGKETRFGVIGSDFFAVVTTLTSTGAVDSMHSSYNSVAGGVLILNMALGEIAPGGVGSGLYGMLVIAILAVFICGLMVGRTPEFLGKRIGPAEMKLASLYLLVVPFVSLIGTGIAISLPATREAMTNHGPHGLSEVLYAFTSAANNNGSAFSGLTADSPFFTIALGLAMLIGRFAPIVLVLALAGKLAVQKQTAVTAGTVPTHRPLFVGVIVGTALLVAGLTFLPALALGPLAEGLAS